MKVDIYVGELLNRRFDRTIQGEKIYENDYFITLQCNNYRTCINKYDILTGLAVIV